MGGGHGGLVGDDRTVGLDQLLKEGSSCELVSDLFVEEFCRWREDLIRANFIHFVNCLYLA